MASKVLGMVDTQVKALARSDHHAAATSCMAGDSSSCLEFRVHVKLGQIPIKAPMVIVGPISVPRTSAAFNMQWSANATQLDRRINCWNSRPRPAGDFELIDCSQLDFGQELALTLTVPVQATAPAMRFCYGCCCLLPSRNRKSSIPGGQVDGDHNIASRGGRAAQGPCLLLFSCSVWREQLF